MGVYYVQICNCGLWKTFVVDDFFPCDALSGKPICIDEKKNVDEMWVMLLQVSLLFFFSFRGLDYGYK